jgi:hypothetical protein
MSPRQFAAGGSMLVAGLTVLSVAPGVPGGGLLAGWIVASVLLAISGAATMATTDRLDGAAALAVISLGPGLAFALVHSLFQVPWAGVVPSTQVAVLATGFGASVLRRLSEPPQPPVAMVGFGVTTPSPGRVEFDASDLAEREHLDGGDDACDSVENDLEQRLLARLHESSVAFSDADEEREPHLSFETSDRHVAQRIERGIQRDGSEWMEGVLLVEFRAGQKTAIVHLPVWPAFASQPKIESELLGGPELDIEVKTIRRWGMRIELTRRAAGLDPDSAELAFFISAQAAIREAA